MSLQPDVEYTGVCVSGAWLKANTGTIGFEVVLQCDAGAMRHTIWLTDNTYKNAIRNFKALGIDTEKLSDVEYRKVQMLLDVQGKPVHWKTKSDSWKGKSKVVVAWMSGHKESDPYAAEAADWFFNQSPSPHESDEPPDMPPMPDESYSPDKF